MSIISALALLVGVAWIVFIEDEPVIEQPDGKIDISQLSGFDREFASMFGVLPVSDFEGKLQDIDIKTTGIQDDSLNIVSLFGQRVRVNSEGGDAFSKFSEKTIGAGNYYIIVGRLGARPATADLNYNLGFGILPKGKKSAKPFKNAIEPVIKNPNTYTVFDNDFNEYRAGWEVKNINDSLKGYTPINGKGVLTFNSLDSELFALIISDELAGKDPTITVQIFATKRAVDEVATPEDPFGVSGIKFRFNQSKATPIFADGFGLGDTSAWENSIIVD